MAGTNWTNITDFQGLVTEANRYTPFWTGIFFMLWAVFTITFLPFGTSVAFLGGSFLALLLGIFLVYMNLIAWKILLMTVGVIILTVIVNTLFSKKE